MQYILSISVLLFSVIVHEVAHGYIAYKRGDDTAKLMGRLTLNPVPHIDIFGSIILPLMLMFANAPVFGWAKPVPVNINKLNNPRTDAVWVSLSGCLANFSLAVAAGFFMWLIRNFATADMTALGSVYYILQNVLVINIILPILNLIPIPPLDGSRVFIFLLPRNMAVKYASIEPYGFLIIFGLLATGILWKIISPAVYFLTAFLSGNF